MPDVGLNLNAITYWSTEEPFIDRFHTAGAWSAWDAAGNDLSSALTLDANGYVANLGDVSKLAVAVGLDPKSATPVDEYVLTYDGTAKISISNAKIVSQTPGRVVFDYVGADDGHVVSINFANLNAGNPLGDIHVVRADQQDLFSAGEIFNPAFIAKVSQWGIVRFMDWEDINASQPVSWADRSQLGDASWSKITTADGVPLEAMVKLANEAHVDMWYNVPTKADDTYVRNALTYIRDHLDPGLKVHVEWSNEVWNTGFAANAYAQSQANALWGNGGTVDHGASIYYGYRSTQIAQIAHDVFGTQAASRLVDLLAGQAAGTGPLTYALQGVARAGVADVSSLFQDYAVGLYFGQEMGTTVKAADEAVVLGWAKSGAAGLDAAFHELEFGKTLTSDFSLAVIAGWISKSGSAAAANGLHLVAYEGGIALGTTRWDTADKATVQDFFDRLLADPRMGDLYTKLLSAFQAAGGTEFVAFNDAAVPSDSGSYGLLNSIYDDGSARYDALLTAGSAAAHLPVGTSAAQTLVALKAGGIVNALGGDDVILAGSGNDTVDGGDGNDSIVGSSGTSDTLGHLIENDFYMGGAGADTIVGGIGNDHIYGNTLSVVAGSVDGADSLSGGAGNDYIQGNAGNDTIDGGDGNDRLYGGADNDSILGGAGNDYLQGNKGNDVLSGDDGNDTIHGGSDDDRVSGDAGNDQLFGDAGNDTLIGGDGDDQLTGGAGSDQFLFPGHDAAFTMSGTNAWKTDEITDFTDGVDHIGLGFHPALLIQSAATSLTAAADVAAQLLQAHAGAADVAAIAVGSDTYLFYDSSGAGGAIDSAIKLDTVNAASLTAADFL